MSAEGRLTYQPSLDGIRAVAVAAVFCFHAEMTWAQGGFLGVSTFFTLSGYLITSLLLAERAATGTIALSRFWARRLRRLMPAALACIALVIVLTATVLTAARSRLPGDVLAAVLDVANWHFYFAGDSYADLFTAPSPLLHFWSLAIEEQFYLAFPLLVWWLVVRRRASTTQLGLVFGVLALAAGVASVLIGPRNPELAYYATFTRAVELLAGSVLAVLLAPTRAAHRDVVSRRLPAPRWLAAAGVLALGLQLFWFTTAGRTAAWLYRGGLPLFAVVSVVLVTGALVPGPLRSVLSIRPLVALGRISYGVYLYHWPVVLVLTEGRTGWAPAPLLLLRAAVTLAVAVVSYHVLEQPVRTGRLLVGWPARLGPVVVPVGVVLAAVAVGAGAPDRTVVAAIERPVVTLPPPTTVPPTTTAASGPVPAIAPASSPAAVAGPSAVPTTPPIPVRMVVFGDSTAKVNAGGLIAWGDRSGRALVSDAGTIAGCGLVREGRILFGRPMDIPAGCGAWPTHWPLVLAANPADVAVVITGPWDVADHQLPGDNRWRAPGDPVFDAALHEEFLAATDTLLATDTRVVWVTALPVDVMWENADDVIDDPARMSRLNEIIAGVVALRPGVGLVDFAAWMHGQPGQPLLDPSVRPDGVHFEEDAATEVAAWLGPAIIAAAPP